MKEPVMEADTREARKRELATFQTTALATPGAALVPTNFAQAMDLAKAMSASGKAVPKHLRDNPGACFAVIDMALRWEMNPFLLAAETYEVNDKIAYMARALMAVCNTRAPIRGRLCFEYDGEGPSRRCRVTALDAADGSTREYVSPLFGSIKPKNSPLWVNDPDQQLTYFSARAFVRRHFPEVLLGVYAVDELQDAIERPIKDVTPADDAVSAALRPIEDADVLDDAIPEQKADPVAVISAAVAEAQALHDSIAETLSGMAFDEAPKADVEAFKEHSRERLDALRQLAPAIVADIEEMLR